MKLSKNKLQILLLMVVAVVSTTGCKSKKASVDTDAYSKNWTIDKAIDDVLSSELEFQNLYSKGSVELKLGDSGKRITSHYKILKDSAMQVSLRVPLLGEAFRMDFTPDRVVIVDRLKGQYAVESFSESEFLKSVDLNYYNLQALLTNKLFVPGTKNIQKADYSRFKISTGSEGLLMLQAAGKPDLVYNFAVDASEKIISLLVTKKNLDNTLQFTYSDFVKHDNQQFYPTVLTASGSMNNKTIGIVVTYSSLDLDKKDFKIDLSIPQKYQKTTIKELLQSYMKGR